MHNSLDTKGKRGSLLGATSKTEKVKDKGCRGIPINLYHKQWNAKEGTKISRQKTIIVLQKYPNCCEKSGKNSMNWLIMQ